VILIRAAIVSTYHRRSEQYAAAQGNVCAALPNPVVFVSLSRSAPGHLDPPGHPELGAAGSWILRQLPHRGQDGFSR
jgi:hypothetical protein